MNSLLQINPKVILTEFKEGVALFNFFSGDTHFIPAPTSFIFELLAKNTFTEKTLQERYKLYVQEKKIAYLDVQVLQCINEAIDTNIIIKVLR